MLPPVMDNSIFSLHKSLQQKNDFSKRGTGKWNNQTLKDFIHHHILRVKYCKLLAYIGFISYLCTIKTI